MRFRTLPVVALTSALLLVAACSSSSDVTTKSASRDSVAATDGSVPDTTPTETTPDTATPDTVSEVATIAWEQCDDPEVTEEELECATLTVPLDYDQPEGETIDLALVRVPAPGDREGAVLFNPGGPGASGFDFIAGNGTYISQAMGLDSLDLIGFDPRGVDRSNGLRCIDDATQDKYLYLDDTPDTPDEEALLESADADFSAGCTANYGDTLQFYSTVNTARDMDAIRAALGDEQVSYLGISYGTYLGAVYATLFPDRVRAMVLDSAFEPNGDTVEEQFETQLVGFDGAFNNWAAWCQDTTSCAFTAIDVPSRWDALRAQLDEAPIAGADDRLANQATMERATTAALYSESQWPILAQALVDAEAGDPTGIFGLADEYNGRSPDGTFDTLFQSFQVITCASGIESQTPPDPEALADRLRGLSPRFANALEADDLLAEAELCDAIVGDVEQVTLSYSGDGPIVVVGGKNDPATPFRWAEEMAAALGDNAHLVTALGEGHGQLLASTCITDIEAALLISLETPAPDTVCEPDPPIEKPAFWDSLPVPDGVGDVVELQIVKDVLGLADTLGYSEVRTTELDSQAASEAYQAALEEAGFVSVGSSDLPFEEGFIDNYLNVEGEALLVVRLGPAAFDDPSMEAAKASVPSTGTVLVLAYLP
jgi:pimeloyl-ACP methyl ester carboxylesterase